MELITVATIGKPFGLKGQVHAFSLTSFPDLRFKKGRKYFISKDGTDTSTQMTLNHVSIKGESLILGFKELANPEEAKAYLGYSVNMDKADAPLPEGYVRYGELVGFKAIDDGGKEIGTLLDVIENATTPSLKFKGVDGKTFYVPFIDVFVGDINHERKTILIHVVEGML